MDGAGGGKEWKAGRNGRRPARKAGRNGRRGGTEDSRRERRGGTGGGEAAPEDMAYNEGVLFDV
ncbi:MAG: hypothetical protein H5T73_12605 [Actinobacteria bacterium]|nr:hypothetical protein [Actinomycetota bacterium]